MNSFNCNSDGGKQGKKTLANHSIRMPGRDLKETDSSVEFRNAEVF